MTKTTVSRSRDVDPETGLTTTTTTHEQVRKHMFGDGQTVNRHTHTVAPGADGSVTVSNDSLYRTTGWAGNVEERRSHSIKQGGSR